MVIKMEIMNDRGNVMYYIYRRDFVNCVNNNVNVSSINKDLDESTFCLKMVKTMNLSF